MSIIISFQWNVLVQNQIYQLDKYSIRNYNNFEIPMYSITKALLLCGLYITSNSQYNVYQVTAQQNPTPSVSSLNQQQNKPTSQVYQNSGQGQYVPIYQKPQPDPIPVSLPPVNQGQQCVPNNNFNKINCSTKGKTQCANSSYSSTAPFTHCGVSHLGVKYDFHDQCQVCNSGQIDFYFQCSCQHTPVICNTNEQCVNGNCVKIITQQPPMNCDCHTDADCSQGTQICQNYKCVARKWHNSNSAKSRPKSKLNSVQKLSKPKSSKKPTTISKRKDSNNSTSKNSDKSVSSQKHPLKAGKSANKKQQTLPGGTRYRDECSSSKAESGQDNDNKSKKLINRVNYHLNKQANSSNGSSDQNKQSSGKNNSNNSKEAQSSNKSKSGKSNASQKSVNNNKSKGKPVASLPKGGPGVSQPKQGPVVSPPKQRTIVPAPKPGPTPILVPGVNC